MLGVLVGTACLFGLIKVLRHGRRWHHGYGYGGGCGSGGEDCCGHGGGWRRHHHRHHHGFGPGRGFDDGDFDRGPGFERGPVMLRGLFSRLQTTPGQERVIAEALRELRAAFRKSADEKAKGARQVAEALRGEDFKTENMGEAFSHLDASTEAVRDATFTALAKIHDALDDRQRKILADLVGRGAGALEHLAEQA